MMDAVERDLFAAIADTPDHDAPRLAWAEWRESKHPGDPRAELVRLGCRIAALAQDSAERATLEKRARELGEIGKKTWGAAYSELASTYPERGFAKNVWIAAQQIAGPAVTALFEN